MIHSQRSNNCTRKMTFNFLLSETKSYKLYFTREEMSSEGINTCIETSGYADNQKFQEILPFTDLFLFDYKETAEEYHKDLTGVGQELILSNLDYIAKNRARIILRCPLIPKINDRHEQLHGISLLSQKYESIERVEILPYHNYAESKWTEIGKNNLLRGMPSANQEFKEKCFKILLDTGCTKCTY